MPPKQQYLRFDQSASIIAPGREGSQLEGPVRCPNLYASPGTAYILSAEHEGLMTIAEQINLYLTQHSPNTFCDGCIARELSLTKPQHAQQVTSALGTTRDFVRDAGVCEMCGRGKKVIRRS